MNNVSVTQTYYIKQVNADSASAMKALDAVLCADCAPETQSQNAGVIQ